MCKVNFFLQISELAKRYSGLYTLTSSDLSAKSWISVQWYARFLSSYISVCFLNMLLSDSLISHCDNYYNSDLNSFA